VDEIMVEKKEKLGIFHSFTYLMLISGWNNGSKERKKKSTEDVCST